MKDNERSEGTEVVSTLFVVLSMIDEDFYKTSFLDLYAPQNILHEIETLREIY